MIKLIVKAVQKRGEKADNRRKKNINQKDRKTNCNLIEEIIGKQFNILCLILTESHHCYISNDHPVFHNCRPPGRQLFFNFLCILRL